MPESLNHVDDLGRTSPTPVAEALLEWYARHARTLPWRVGPADRQVGERPDPYRVWLSEVMLQQTTVKAVKDYFHDFTTRWPTLDALAAAPLDDILTRWAGLGYYSRARKLKACADELMKSHGGRFPETAAALQQLPGIGPYTSAAIASLVFDEPIAVVDGNVERVFSRLHRIETPLPAAKEIVRQMVTDVLPFDRPGEFAEATMDLGATICTPKKPACGLCPFSTICAARLHDTPERFPIKAPKAEKPTRTGTVFAALRSDGAVLLRKRPERGLLGAMAEVPGTNWSKKRGDIPSEEPPFDGEWRTCPSRVRHTFTHFHLELIVERLTVPDHLPAPDGYWWASLSALDQEPLPSVMLKVIATATD